MCAPGRSQKHNPPVHRNNAIIELWTLRYLRSLRADTRVRPYNHAQFDNGLASKGAAGGGELSMAAAHAAREQPLGDQLP